MPTSFAVPVELIAGLLLLGAVLAAVFTVWVVRKPVWVVPAIVVAALAVKVFSSPPVVPKLAEGVPAPIDVGGKANFGQRYNMNRTLYGEPVGNCGEWKGILSCWTLYHRMESHPENSNPYFQILNGNVGQELLAARKRPRDPNPVLPEILLSYFASEAERNVDRMYWFGHPITDPRVEGDRTVQYFDKAILSWPTASTDPSTVARETVGKQLWILEKYRVDPVHPDPWTEERRNFAIFAGILLLVSLAPLTPLAAIPVS